MIFILWLVGFFFLNLGDLEFDRRLISLILVSATVVSMSLVVDNFPYFKNNFYFTFLFALGFLLIGCCLEKINFFAGLFFLHLILAQILYKAQEESFIFNSFDLGFYMGLAIIFYPPFWVFGVFLLLHFIILGKTQIVNLIFSLLGMLALFILCIELMAIFDAWYYWETFVNQLEFSPIQLKLPHLFLIPLFLIAILGLGDYYSNINRQSSNKKVVFFAALLWFIFALVYLVLYNETNDNGLLLLLLPIVLFSSNFLNYSKMFWQKEVVLWIFVICLLLYRFHMFIKVPDLFDTVTF